MLFQKVSTFIFSISLLVYSNPAAAWGWNAENSCPLATVDNISDFSKEILRPIAVASIEKNPSEFCNNEMAQRFLFSSSQTTGNPQKASYKEYADALANHSLNALVGQAESREIGESTSNWYRSLVPLEESRLAATNNIEPGITGMPARINLDDAVKYLQKDKCSFARQLGNGNEIKITPAAAYNIGNTAVAKTYACSELMGVLGSLSCSQSMDTVARIANPSGSITGVEIYKKVLDDSRYDEGLRIAALKIAERVQKKDTAGGDYFSDLKGSFIKAGASDLAAEEMAWNSAALLATAGPNTSFRIRAFKGEAESSEKRLALHTIASCLPVLDHRSSEKGRVYSFPPGVSGACNTGKSYHFWFTAYLARRAALESGNPEASAATAFQAEKLYQMKQRYAGADAATATNLYSPTSQIIRGDISYAAAGAVYGANAAGNRKNLSLEVDKNLSGLIKSGGNGSAGAVASVASFVGQDTAKSYGNWMSKFDANSAFNSARGAGFPKQVNSAYLSFEKTPETSSCKEDRAH